MSLVIRNRILYGGILSLTFAAFLTIFLFADFLSSWKWLHPEIHSTIETLGGISSILICFVLFQETREVPNDTFFLVAIGFACMGILDTFHAMCKPGEAFVFLHSAASMAGSFFFALIWLQDFQLLKNLLKNRLIAFGSIIIAVSIGLRALLSPEDVPKIIAFYNERFTLAALLINMLASLFFLISVPKFYTDYRRHKNQKSLIFMYLALLFGIAELIFQFSTAWDGIWWSWHLIRLIAFLITLVLVFKQYRQISHVPLK